jgi:hypothetical protein
MKVCLLEKILENVLAAGGIIAAVGLIAYGIYKLTKK